MRFGRLIRNRREFLESRSGHRNQYSLRAIAGRVGIQPSYLSKVERGVVAPPSEATILALAVALEIEEIDTLLAAGGKMPSDVVQTIIKKPELFCPLVRLLGSLNPGDLEIAINTINEALKSRGAANNLGQGSK